MHPHAHTDKLCWSYPTGHIVCHHHQQQQNHQHHNQIHTKTGQQAGQRVCGTEITQSRFNPTAHIAGQGVCGTEITQSRFNQTAHIAWNLHCRFTERNGCHISSNLLSASFFTPPHLLPRPPASISTIPTTWPDLGSETHAPVRTLLVNGYIYLLKVQVINRMWGTIPSRWLKILSNVNSPVFSRYLCMTLRTLKKHTNISY